MPEGDHHHENHEGSVTERVQPALTARPKLRPVLGVRHESRGTGCLTCRDRSRSLNTGQATAAVGSKVTATGPARTANAKLIKRMMRFMGTSHMKNRETKNVRSFRSMRNQLDHSSPGTVALFPNVASLSATVRRTTFFGFDGSEQSVIGALLSAAALKPDRPEEPARDQREDAKKPNCIQVTRPRISHHTTITARGTPGLSGS